jgi:hypothetical protein
VSPSFRTVVDGDVFSCGVPRDPMRPAASGSDDDGGRDRDRSVGDLPRLCAI